MKKKISKKFNSTAYKIRLKTQYMRKYYNMFMKAYRFTGLDYQQENYLMRSMWARGKVACFKATNGDLVFCPYAPFDYNVYDYPAHVSLINTRGVSFIPSDIMEVDSDVVIGWALPDMNPIKEIVENIVDQIVIAKMVMNVNLFTHKLPWTIAISPEDKERMVSLINAIMEDEPVVYTDFDDLEKVKNLINTTPYIIDKLNNYVKDLESELKTQLGFDNINYEKKERMNIDETNSNNEEINFTSGVFQDELEKLCDRINNILQPSEKVGVEAKNGNAMRELLKDKPIEDDGGDDDDSKGN